jgi:hypothetical protein
MQRLTVAIGTVHRDSHVVSFGDPAPILDLASFSFQVPICASSPKHTAAPTKHTNRVNRIVLVFMFSPD